MLDDWVLHCAILAKPSSRSNELVSYLINTFPAYLEKKSAAGETPLMLAFSLGRFEFAKLLIKAGADQSTRDSTGENLLHKLACNRGPSCEIRAFIELLHPELRTHMFSARKNLREGGETPFHKWVSQTHTRSASEETVSEDVKVATLLLSHSQGAELEMLNGAGDTCLHTAIMQQNLALVHELVKFRPQLLYRENAVGRTPSEVAHDMTLGDTFRAPQDPFRSSNAQSLESWATRQPGEFLHDSEVKSDGELEKLKALQGGTLLRDEYSSSELGDILKNLNVREPGAKLVERTGGISVDTVTAAKVIWDICRTATAKHPGKRRLVSLNEANDVARRLGESHSRSRYFSVESRRNDDDEDGSNAGGDDSNGGHDFFDEMRRWPTWELPSSKTIEEREPCKECNWRHGDYY